MPAAIKFGEIYVDNELVITIYESGAPGLDDINITVTGNTIEIQDPYGGGLSAAASFDFAEGYSLTDTDFSTGYNKWIITSPVKLADYSGVVGPNTTAYLTSINPYSITITNKEGIKLLTKDKDIHFDDDVKITIDESLLGGGEAKKYNFSMSYTSQNGQPAEMSIDGEEFIDIGSWDEEITGSANIIVLWCDGEIEGYGVIGDETAAKFTFIKQSGSYPASCLIITLLKDNAVISITGES